METRPVPTFEEWVEYCFTQGYADWAGWSDDDDGTVTEREIRFCDRSLGALRTTQYLTRLFESPAFIADRYTDDQITLAVQFLITSPCNNYWQAVWKPEVPEASQMRCYRSVATLFTDLFDRVCGDRGRDPDREVIRSGVQPDGAVYMIPEGPFFGPLWRHEELRQLVEPCMEVVSTALGRCRTSGCRVSALHCIGHHASVFSSYPETAERLRTMVDVFLARPDVPEWLCDYALQARAGRVQ